MNITLADEDRRIKLNVLNSSLIQKQLRVLTLNKLTGNLSSAVIQSGVMQRKKESIVLWLRLFSWRFLQKNTQKPLPMNASIRGIPNDGSKFRKCLAALPFLFADQMHFAISRSFPVLYSWLHSFAALHVRNRVLSVNRLPPPKMI